MPWGGLEPIPCLLESSARPRRQAWLAKRTAPPGTDVSRLLSLPSIPAQDVVLYCALNDRRSREAMRIMALAFQQAN